MSLPHASSFARDCFVLTARAILKKRSARGLRGYFRGSKLAFWTVLHLYKADLPIDSCDLDGERLEEVPEDLGCFAFSMTLF